MVARHFLLPHVFTVEVDSTSLAIASIMLGQTLQRVLVGGSVIVITVFQVSSNDLPHGGVEVLVYSREEEVEMS
jgi:hypothetical protein